jgi:hypothetical protein
MDDEEWEVKAVLDDEQHDGVEYFKICVRCKAK